MAKKAYLVTTTFVSRVVVDGDIENDAVWNDAVLQAQGAVYQKIAHGEFAENVESVEEDTECPYSSDDEYKIPVVY